MQDIIIAHFGSNISDWQTFFEIFKTVIIYYNSLSNINLKSYLKANENLYFIVNDHISSRFETPLITKFKRQNLKEFMTN